MRDKKNKKVAMCVRIREQGGGFVMPVDADDLISNRIAGLVNSGKSKFGYVVNTGYEYDEKAKRIKVSPRFYNVCGTSAVMKCDVDELPSNVSDSEEPYPILTGHTLWEKIFDDKGTPLLPFPFMPVIYKCNTGENDSIHRNNIGLKRRVLRWLSKDFQVNEKLREEFNSYE